MRINITPPNNSRQPYAIINNTHTLRHYYSRNTTQILYYAITTHIVNTHTYTWPHTLAINNNSQPLQE